MKIGLLVLSWCARNVVALGLIVLVLLAGRHAAQPAAEYLRAQSEMVRTVPRQLTAYTAAASAFDAYSDRRRAEAERTGALLARESEAELRARRQTLGPRIARERAARLSSPRLAIAAANGDAHALFGHYRAEAEIALLERERRLIDAALGAKTVERERLRLEAQRREAEQEVTTSDDAWRAANRRAERLEGRFMAGPRNAICRLNPLDLGCPNYRALVLARREAQAAAARNKAARARIALIDRAERGLTRAEAVADDVHDLLGRQRAAISSEITGLDQRARTSPVVTGWRMVADVLPSALLILMLAILSPLLTKAVLFFWVAPLGERRPPIHLLTDDRGEITMLGRSAVSQRIALHPGDELLVLPQAVQSTPHHAAKRTRWLLNRAIPLSSIASGLFALTQIRLEHPDSILVSATSGPLAEIVLIRVERGSALVLRPRALRGLLQPALEPVRITRRWRLGLSAWLTLQFRYVIFHGPCTLVIEGARGVRMERAGLGRGSNQAATLGFSAGLAYAVSRSETFGAYLFGKQALFNDSFISANGVYLQEEAPWRTRQGRWWDRGLRGMGDAVLKVVGL